VIDVGANIGSHGIPLAHQVGRDGHVIAIEPTDYGFSRLKANAALNPELDSRLILVQAALIAGGKSPDSGENVRFYSRWPLKGSGADRHAKHLGKLEATKGARFLSLDNLLRTRCLSWLNSW
jgi:FkbM family methyltransferase